MTRAIGWIVALLVVAGGLAFYNLSFIPQQSRLLRQQEEIEMWTKEIIDMRAAIEASQTEPDTVYRVVFTWDELFSGSESFELTGEGEAGLRGCITQVQSAPGLVEVIGHTDNTVVPKKLASLLPTNWEYAAARASVVARALAGWGISSGRIVVASAGDARPRADNTTPEGRGRNRRVEILIRK